MLHAAITNSYYGMEYMLYGNNTAGSARRRGNENRFRQNRETRAEPLACRQAGKADGLPDRAGVFLRLYSHAGTAGHFRRKRKIKEIQPGGNAAAVRQTFCPPPAYRA